MSLWEGALPLCWLHLGGISTFWVGWEGAKQGCVWHYAQLCLSQPLASNRSICRQWGTGSPLGHWQDARGRGAGGPANLGRVDDQVWGREPRVSPCAQDTADEVKT